jgi:hypothetical protein
MPATLKRRQPSSGSSGSALPAAPQWSFPQQWRSLRLVANGPDPALDLVQSSGSASTTASTKRGQPCNNEDTLPAANQFPFPQQWRPLHLVQRERREKTDELWRRLDDLVTDAGMMSPNPSSPAPT